MEKTGYKILLQSGSVAKEDLDRVFQESESSENSFSELLVQWGVIKENQMLELYSKNLGIPIINLKTASVDPAVLAKVPIKFPTYYKFFPVKLQNRKLTIAVSKLMEVHTVDEIRFGLGYEIETVFALGKDIEEMINRHYGLAADTVEKILTQQISGGETPVAVPSEDLEDIGRLADAPSVVQLVNQIIFEAFKKRASDIHLEPYRGKVRLRYRIDGELHEQRVPPEMKKFFMAIISRVKIMANLNIVERRLPQDGKARVKTQNQNLDLRISSIPTPHGESMVIRILPSNMVIRLEDLGFHATHLKTFRELIEKPHGIIFVTGPTGSGKSTSLYAGLQSINTSERKIITIEDPVEYELEGITQLQVNPEIGLNFARGLRSMLRHDPDVMMVGEVRDLETADIAIRVALTGHLVMSTLHTNDAASGATRLLDIGVEPFLVASSVIAFIAQRLVRVICPYCKKENPEVLAEVKERIVRELKLPHMDFPVYEGHGCDECHGTGFSGRTAIHEFLLVGPQIRKLIFRRTPSEHIKAKAMELGMTSLRQDGWRKVLEGLTTPEEILQVTPPDEFEHHLTSAPEEDKHKNGMLFSMVPGNKVKIEGPVSQSFLEKRSYPRIKVKVPVKYQIIHKDEESKKKEEYRRRGKIAQSEDLSASGVAFLVPEILTSGTMLEMQIELSDSEGAIECIGKVVRQIQLEGKPEDSEYGFMVAATFLAIASGDRMRIERFCREKGLSEKV
ncbi:MAG: Flp pilus assembly complex ATPase component TadA [Candidatus Omnitrophica bacterium]|nr:Flp pilus assembly complex ATPase component TadA [Candidatus Omnitrophota bacterium]